MLRLLVLRPFRKATLARSGRTRYAAGLRRIDSEGQMPKANFAVVRFNEHLGDNVGDLSAPNFTFVGNQTSLKNFDVPGIPTDEAYLIIQVLDVQNMGHRIQINGADLPGVDIVRTRDNEWQDVMDVIPARFLRQGNNTVQIRRASGGDNILVASAVIQWKEQD